MKQFTQSEVYPVKNNGSIIRLSIEIGFGQSSLTDVYLDGKLINDRLKDSMSGLELGLDTNLIYKELICNTAVYDIQPDTNQTSYGFILRRGKRVLRMPKQKCKVQKAGDVVFYTTKVLFIG